MRFCHFLIACVATIATVALAADGETGQTRARAEIYCTGGAIAWDDFNDGAVPIAAANRYIRTSCEVLSTGTARVFNCTPGLYKSTLLFPIIFIFLTMYNTTSF